MIPSPGGNRLAIAINKIEVPHLIPLYLGGIMKGNQQKSTPQKSVRDLTTRPMRSSKAIIVKGGIAFAGNVKKKKNDAEKGVMEKT